VRTALRTGSLTADGWLPVEGYHLVEEALRTGIEVGETFVRDDARAPDGVGRVYRLGGTLFRQLGATREPQGIVALVRPRTWSLDQVIADAGLVVVLCGLQDPGNTGAIIRLADAFGCAGLIAVGATVSLTHDKVVRASAGSMFRLPHLREESLMSVHAIFRRESIALVGTAPGTGDRIDGWDWNRPTAILFGNEGRGLDQTERSLCERILSIPVRGDVESLNAASAAAIVLYEATRASRA
jgi:TrmH family RNA methyltransferase